jgi:hypothetical protein
MISATYGPNSIPAASTNSFEKTATYVAVFSFEAPFAFGLKMRAIGIARMWA